MAHEKNCLTCGKSFVGNINRQFCTDACRKYYSRHGQTSLAGVKTVLSADKGGQVRTQARATGSRLGDYAAKKGIDMVAKLVETSLIGSTKPLQKMSAHTPSDKPLQIIDAQSSLANPLLGLLEDKAQLSPAFSHFLGQLTYPFKMLVWGLPGSGKSTFCMQLANEIARKHRLLYIAGEEALNSQTLLDKQRRTITGNSLKNCIFLDRLPKSISEWKQVLYPNGQLHNLQGKAVFYDSVTKLNITPFHVDSAAHDFQLPELAKSLSHIFITHAHKDGQQYRGDGSWGHEVDVIIRVEKGGATTEKNRFGEVGRSIKLF